MIDVPFAAVIPAHPSQKLSLEVRHKVGKRISDQSLPAMPLLLPRQALPDIGAHPFVDREGRVALSLRTPLLLMLYRTKFPDWRLGPTAPIFSGLDPLFDGQLSFGRFLPARHTENIPAPSYGKDHSTVATLHVRTDFSGTA